jgi:predicted DNA-binding transcriptional regulator AlpA
MTRKCDPVGAVEIAQRLNVKRRTVDQWRQRDLGFPPPRWTVGGRPAWNWDDIEAWAKARTSPPED